jgi:hypothetical protein
MKEEEKEKMMKYIEEEKNNGFLKEESIFHQMMEEDIPISLEALSSNFNGVCHIFFEIIFLPANFRRKGGY